ncbi:MAG: hypothetical protein HUJ18_06975 [Marinobacter sp.]|nr:hypothetical protein [Marinobacter sp.]
MYEISLAEGFGPIRFGSPPSEVKAAWGSELCYEDWMGGNLENFLYFRGLLVGFSGEIEDQPTENSYVCMFQIKTVHPIGLWGRDITQATWQEVASLLSENGLEYTTPANGIMQCVDHELQFQFDATGVLSEVYLARKHS